MTQANLSLGAAVQCCPLEPSAVMKILCTRALQCGGRRLYVASAHVKCS